MSLSLVLIKHSSKLWGDRVVSLKHQTAERILVLAYLSRQWCWEFLTLLTVGDLICKMGVHSYLMKLFREISKILCIDLGPQNSTEMVYDNITIICRPTWVRRVWFELLVSWLPHVFSLIILSSWRFLYQMVSSERNFLQPVIKKESEPADWGATCMPPSQQDYEDQGNDTDGLASPCRHRFLLQTIMHATKIQSTCKCMGNFSP